MNLCILIPLLVGTICALLGYLLGRLLGGDSNHDDCDDRVAKLIANLEACRRHKMSLEGDLKTAKASLASSLAATSIVASIPFDGATAKSVFGKKIKENDLTVVEGIGPKIQQLFHNHEVKTWKALSECSIEKCQDVLTSGGDRFKMHKPGSWPKQAKLAYEGRWSDLLKWQDELDGGK